MRTREDFLKLSTRSSLSNDGCYAGWSGQAGYHEVYKWHCFEGVSFASHTGATARVAVGKYPTVGNSYKCMRIAGGGCHGRLGSLTRGSPHYLRLRSGPGPPIATIGGPGGPPGGPRYRRGCGTKPAGTSLRSIWSSSRSNPSICPIIWCISCSFFLPFVISGDPSIPPSTSPFGSN